VHIVTAASTSRAEHRQVREPRGAQRGRSCSSRSRAPRRSSPRTRRTSACASSTSAAARRTSRSSRRRDRAHVGHRARGQQPHERHRQACARRWRGRAHQAEVRLRVGRAWSTRRDDRGAVGGWPRAARWAGRSCRDHRAARGGDLPARARPRDRAQRLLECSRAGVVITGGTSQLPGMRRLAEEIIGVPCGAGCPGIGGSRRRGEAAPSLRDRRGPRRSTARSSGCTAAARSASRRGSSARRWRTHEGTEFPSRSLGSSSEAELTRKLAARNGKTVSVGRERWARVRPRRKNQMNIEFEDRATAEARSSRWSASAVAAATRSTR
jgi:hypothetical protein